MIGIGDCHRVSVNVIADNSQTLRNDSLLTWRNSGSVLLRYPAPAWPAARRWPLFRPQPLYQQHNKADTDAAEDHWNPILETISIPNAVVGAQTITRIWSTFHTTCRREYRRASAVLWDFQVDPARYTTRQNAGDKAGIAVTPPISIK